MKKLDVKSIITCSLIFTICAIAIVDTVGSFFGVEVAINAGILDLIKITTGGVISYFFTRKAVDSEHKKGE